MSNHNRVHAGVPDGGQYAESARTRPSIDLGLDTDQFDEGQDFDTSPEAVAESLIDPKAAPHRVRAIDLPDIEQAEQTRNELVDTCEARNPIDDEHVPNLVMLTKDESREAARESLPHMSENEFDYRWARVESSHAHMAAFASRQGRDFAADTHSNERIVARGGDVDDEKYAHQLAVEWSRAYTASLDEAIAADQDAEIGALRQSRPPMAV